MTQETTSEASTSSDVETLLARLRRVEGQIRGIQRMLEEDRVCEDIVTQVMAARTALDQVSLLILDHHVERCICSDQPAEDAMRTMHNALKMWMRLGAPTAESDK
ncbi:MAG: metal-sensitive transcriptional regulator [Dehalococcoidia bacterium]